MTGNMILLVLIVSGWTGAANALYNENSIKFLDKELNNGSLFGFSTAFHTDKRLIVSAPQADHMGQVYHCNLSTLDCTKSEVIFDKVDPFDRNRTLVNANQEYQDWWLGATVATGSSFYVACAPRVYQRDFGTYSNIRRDLYGSFGQCFIEKRQNDGLVELLIPPYSVRVRNATKLESRLDSFGWSLNVAKDDTLLVGGPALQPEDKGAVEVYPDTLNQIWKIPENEAEKNKSDYYRSIISVIKPYYYDVDNVEHELGYSVATGNFFSTNENDFFYAIGTTYGKDGRGMVLFFERAPKESSKKLGKKQYFSITDDDSGASSMFAAALCPATLDDDERMDLLVGAPTRSDTQSGGTTDIYNLGAVHVYVSNDKNKLIRKYTIKGKVPYGYFGLAITNIGDMDGDKRDEVVIGAPYENEGRGAIYLYYGADFSRGTEPECGQRIAAEDTGYFGFSLTTIKNFDYDDSYGLSVGMPAKNRVAIIPFMTIVKADLFEKGTDLQNRPTEDFFVFQSCVNLTYPSVKKNKTINGNLTVSVQINHKNATLNLTDNANTFTYYVDLRNAEVPHCRDITVLTPKDGDYSNVIEYITSVTQAEDLRKDKYYDSSKALLLDRPENTKHATIWAATDCKTKGECKPVLNMTLESMFKEPYMVGSTDMQKIAVHVNNTGDTAYSACVVLRFVGVSVVRTTPFCYKRRSADALECSPFGPIRNITWDIDGIELDTKNLTSLDKEISITATLYNQCKNKSSTQTTKNLTLNLTYDSKGVAIEGGTSRGHLVQMTEEDLYYNRKYFEHMYSIVNTGVTKWIGLNFTIELQKQPYYTHRKPKIYYKGSYHLCAPKQSEKNDSKTYQVTCPLYELNKTKIDVYFTIDIIPGSLGSILPYKNITISTNFTLILDNERKTESITTTIWLRKSEVPLWIIFAACLFGLSLLGFIAFILYECGCLRRKKKEDLKYLKRRASVRMSMRESARNSMATSSNRTSRDESGARMSITELRAAIAEKNASRLDSHYSAPETEGRTGEFNEVETNFDNVPLNKN